MRVVVLSFAVHAVAFVLLIRVPRRPHAPEPTPPEPIEIVEDEPPPVVPSERAKAGALGSVGETPRTASVARGIAHAQRGNDGPAAAPEEMADQPQAAPVWSGSFVTLTPSQLGLGRENPFLPSSPPPAASNTPDLGLSFGPSSEGPALVVFKDVTSRSLAPLEGRARFTVRANADGDLLGIDLDESTGGSGWDDARRLALDELRGKKLTVPRGARGINLRFEIVSEVSYPTGQRTKHEFDVRGPAIVLPDESNIGQVRTRKIHTRHLGTEVL